MLLKDTGLFPIAYSQSAFSSINGKLHLTNRRLLFTAGKLQGIGGVAVEGMYVPNPADAHKSDEYLSIPLVERTRVESGRASLTVHVADKKYKFGGMRETNKWAEAATNAIRQHGTSS